MSYRDDVDAAKARSDALARELADLEQRLGDRASLEAQADAVRKQLAAAREQVARARARGTLPVLDKIVIKTPCKESWAGMSGDDHKRFCGRCQKHVYDLSAMTREEAEAMLAAPGEKCVKLYRRPDGTVMTSDCPDGARRRTRGRLAIAGAAIAAAAGIAGTAAALLRGEDAPKPPEHHEVMGAIAVDRNADVERLRQAAFAAENGTAPEMGAAAPLRLKQAAKPHR